jgi:hypothetical protein
MTFKIKGAIFKNTAEKLQQRLGDRYDASKKYPDVDGVFGIREEDRMAFASYIMNAAVNDKGEVPLRVNGYNNTSQSSGVKYLGLTIEPDFKTLKAIEEALLAAVPPAPAAANCSVVAAAADLDDLF